MGKDTGSTIIVRVEVARLGVVVLAFNIQTVLAITCTIHFFTDCRISSVLLCLELHVVEVQSLDGWGIQANAGHVLRPSVDTLFAQIKRTASVRQERVSSWFTKTVQNFKNSVRVVIARDCLDSASLGRVCGSSVDGHFRISRASKA